MSDLVLLYFCIGIGLSSFAFMKGQFDGTGRNIPVHAFIVTVFVWPYTLYLALRSWL